MERILSARETFLGDGFPDGPALAGESVPHADVGQGVLNTGVAVEAVVVHDDELSLRGFLGQVEGGQPGGTHLHVAETSGDVQQ